MRTIRVGTRGSKLALTQTNQVIDLLRAAHPEMDFETVIIKTTGDIRSGVAFEAVGAKGMFVKEIEEALLAKDIDFAVHSLKDMPSELPAGLCLASTPARVDPRDALISNVGTLKELPEHAAVGTSSPRRRAQLKAFRRDLEVQELRGNLDTRLRKLDENQYDAIVLACAGLERLGLADRITERLPIEVSIPAPGQGSLALEARESDLATFEMLAVLNDPDTADCVACERAFQDRLNAGCTVPAGALATVLDHEFIRLSAIIAAPDGSEILRTEVDGQRSSSTDIGKMAALTLLERGGSRWLV